jgi:3-dehydroquinate synthase
LLAFVVNITPDGMRINLARTVDNSYDIVFGSKMFPRIAAEMKQMNLGVKHAILTDSNVASIYAGDLEKAFEKEGLACQTFVSPAGEEYKSLDECARLYNELAEAKFGRDSVIYALGGGVVGDRAGFIAATFLRGVPLVMIPTTTISQADSSVGGKTGVDIPAGKNLVGAFYQPKRDYIDVDTLKTLKAGHYISGLAESIKHGNIKDVGYLLWLSDHVNLILAGDTDCLMHMAKTNCRIKGEVVEQDTEEKGLRSILNYGHTLGHALEKLSGYKMMHGDGVSIGMSAAVRIASALNVFSGEIHAQDAILRKFGLQTKIPDEILSRFSLDDIINATRTDKKAAGGKVRYTLPRIYGTMNEFDGKYKTPVDDEIVRAALTAISK